MDADDEDSNQDAETSSTPNDQSGSTEEGLENENDDFVQEEVNPGIAAKPVAVESGDCENSLPVDCASKWKKIRQDFEPLLIIARKTTPFVSG